MLQKISDDNFDEKVINSDSLFVLLFSSPWCSNCKNIMLQMVALSERNDSAGFGRIDITTSPQKHTPFEVMSIPTVLIFKDGKEFKRLTGNVSEKELKRGIGRAS